MTCKTKPSELGQTNLVCGFLNEQNERFNWYKKKPTGSQRYATLTCVQAGNEKSEILSEFVSRSVYMQDNSSVV